MSAALLLSRLEGVRRKGGSWRAICPIGHAKARSSLVIGETNDGRVFLHCFVCHDTPAILRAVGLELADLSPERSSKPSPEASRWARDAFRRNGGSMALNELARESTVVLLLARDILAGKVPRDRDLVRLALAEERIARAREVLA